VSLLSFVIVQVCLSRSNRRSAVWRLAVGSSPWRANFLQLVSRVMVGLDPDTMWDITWRFESYASTKAGYASRKASFNVRSVRCGFGTMWSMVALKLWRVDASVGSG
jgi:hypothetical protein